MGADSSSQISTGDWNGTFYGIDFINGHWKSEELWQQYGRVKRLRMMYNGKVIAVLQLADTRRWQRITFPDIMVKAGDVLSLQVMEYYPGKKPGVALSEIVLQGAH